MNTCLKRFQFESQYIVILDLQEFLFAGMKTIEMDENPSVGTDERGENTNALETKIKKIYRYSLANAMNHIQQRHSSYVSYYVVHKHQGLPCRNLLAKTNKAISCNQTYPSYLDKYRCTRNTPSKYDIFITDPLFIHSSSLHLVHIHNDLLMYRFMLTDGTQIGWNGNETNRFWLKNENLSQGAEKRNESEHVVQIFFCTLITFFVCDNGGNSLHCIDTTDEKDDLIRREEKILEPPVVGNMLDEFHDFIQKNIRKNLTIHEQLNASTTHCQKEKRKTEVVTSNSGDLSDMQNIQKTLFHYLWYFINVNGRKDRKENKFTDKFVKFVNLSQTIAKSIPLHWNTLRNSKNVPGTDFDLEYVKMREMRRTWMIIEQFYFEKRLLSVEDTYQKVIDAFQWIDKQLKYLFFLNDIVFSFLHIYVYICVLTTYYVLCFQVYILNVYLLQ
ncbi:hypothetical protein RFI_31184 [Reticulomyxa filosa]|uniref:Uncharacterized protein n=1 Tax=Reticulomyxa filosa TaxID=46433 RepID=X6LZP0_RETFI|nr:hypothetical protein RFI_31184 [Reticulomyxa filosa]|eukprot:ETO06210.1 hypothetical protein RFI_31184 [Reticulomyxa filosa]